MHIEVTAMSWIIAGFREVQAVQMVQMSRDAREAKQIARSETGYVGKTRLRDNGRIGQFRRSITSMMSIIPISPLIIDYT